MTTNVISLPDRIAHLHKRVQTLDSRADWRLTQIKRLRCKLAAQRAHHQEQLVQRDQHIRQLQERLITAGMDYRALTRRMNELHAERDHLAALHAACYCHTEEHQA